MSGIYLQLFFGFLKVGCFSFGGAYAAIPLIRDVVLSYGWISDDMLTYMIAVSESTPGPIMVNLATYVGNAQGGPAGAFVATLAVILPAFFIILLLTALLAKVIEHKYVQAILCGLKPCMIGVILATACHMILKNSWMAGGTFASLKTVDLRAVVITLLLALLYFGVPKLTKKQISPILFIVIAACVGIVGYGIG